MGAAETRGRITFALAVAVLAAGAFAIAVLHHDEPRLPAVAKSGRAPESPARGGGHPRRRDAEVRKAETAARRFATAYLRYQEGRLGDRDRAALLRHSTAEFGEQLVRAPVRVLPGTQPPRQFVARIAAVNAGLFDGSPALLASVVIAGSGGTHLLNTSLVERRGAWVVAGVGP